MKNITYLTPNAHEAALLFPGEEPDSLPEKHQGKLIVMLGADGAAAWDGKMLKISARKAKVVDTTGAGDAFNGVLCYGLSCEYTLEKTLRFANTAAGLSHRRLWRSGRDAFTGGCAPLSGWQRIKNYSVRKSFFFDAQKMQCEDCFSSASS